MATLSLIGRISLDSTQWKSGLESIEKSFKPSADRMASILDVAFSKNPIFGAAGAGAEALGLGKLFHFVEEKSAAMMERLQELTRGTALTGLEPHTFEQLANLFKAIGSNPEAIARPMQALEIALEKVRKGGPEAVKTFEALQKLGATWNEMKSGETQDVFLSIFDKLKGAAADAGKLAAIREVFGKGGLEMLPAAALGRESKAAEGGILTGEERAEMEKLRAEMFELKVLWRDMGLEAEKFGMRVMRALSDWRNLISLGRKELGEESGFVLSDKGRAEMDARHKRQADAQARRQKEELEKFQAEARAEKDREIQERIDEKTERLRLQKLKPEERRASLERQIAGLEGLEPFLPLEGKEKLADLRLALQSASAKSLDKVHIPSDSLRSIGNLLGSDPNSVASRDTLKEIRDILRDIQTNSRINRSSGLVFPTN